jgi:hypothetical protein
MALRCTTNPAALEGPGAAAGLIFHEWYVRVAPSPENWWTLVRKCNELDRQFQGWRPADIQAIKAPTLIIIGDSEHCAARALC